MVPNLDAMTESDLMAFWSRYHRATRKDAADLIGDKRRGYIALAWLLAAYACDKACAMSLREKGEIARAMTYEHACDLRYERIPTDLRW